MSKNNDEFSRNSRFQRFGLVLAIIFFLISVVMVIRNHGGTETIFSPDTKVITFAHWQLEDGFREGFEEAIKIYEEEKARQGVKVKVRQLGIPIRGYSQWLLTQLIGGEPADVLELTGSSDIFNQYFVALSPYIGEKNPWNRGTPLENYSWRESFADDMLASLDPNYSEFFSVNLFMMTVRVYANVDLIRKATGSDKMPDTVTEWLEICRKVREYGKATNRPVIPIGVRGFDKATLSTLFYDYNAQLNGDLSDFISAYGFGGAPADAFEAINNGTLDRERLLDPVRLIAEIGQYFAEGFPSIDLEQTKYLFFSGNVGFFIDGSYNAWSMVNNSPFEVKVIRLPELTAAHPLGGHALGRVNELGSGLGGKFGIPKRTKNFDLALDFLRFITSYRINQLTMVEHSRWLSSLKQVKYEGFMKDLEPITDTGYTGANDPFNNGGYSYRRVLQLLEKVIIENPSDPGQVFWDGFLDDRPILTSELHETVLGIQRTLWSMDGSRSALSLGSSNPSLSEEERELFRRRGGITQEGVTGRYRNLDDNLRLMRELGKLKREKN